MATIVKELESVARTWFQGIGEARRKLHYQDLMAGCQAKAWRAWIYLAFPSLWTLTLVQNRLEIKDQNKMER